MKKIKKRLLLLAMAILFSCQPEEQVASHDHEHQKNAFSKVNLNDILIVQNRMNLDKQIYANRIKNNKSTGINYFEKIVPTSINAQVYDFENNLHYYTFGLNLFEVDQKTNLVVKETPTGNNYYIYVFKPTNYQLWKTAIETNDTNYTAKVEVDFFEIHLSDYVAFSDMCLQTTEVWTCPYREHTLGEGDWYNCTTFKSGSGMNGWVRSYTTEMVSCGGMGGTSGGDGAIGGDNNTTPGETGSGTVSSATPNLNVSDPCLLDATTSFTASLNPAQLAWWNTASNNDQVMKISNYLGENGCSQGDRDFAKEIIDQNLKTGLKFDIELSKKSPAFIDFTAINTTTPEGKKMDCIYKKLINSPTFTNLFVNTFGGTQEKLNIKFETEYDLRSEDGKLLDGKCSPVSVIDNKYYQTITIDSDILIGIGEKSNILIAKTIIHELIHAYINIRYLNITFGASLSFLSDETLEEMMYYAFRPSNPLQLGDSHHVFMFDHLIPVFKNIFSEIVNDLLSAQDVNDFNNARVTDTNGAFIENFDFMNFYKYISFQGLENSESYMNGIENNSIEKRKYLEYYNHAKNSSKDCQ